MVKSLIWMYLVEIMNMSYDGVQRFRELIIYGNKGLAAYLKHANELAYDNEEVNAFMQNTLAKLLNQQYPL